MSAGKKRPRDTGCCGCCGGCVADDAGAVDLLLPDTKRRAAAWRPSSAARVSGMLWASRAACGSPNGVSVGRLADEVLAECLSWLAGLELAATARCVSRRWARLSRTGVAWGGVAERFAAVRAGGVPHPCASLRFSRQPDEVTEGDYASTLDYYKHLFSAATASCRTALERSFADAPSGAALERWWFGAARLSLRRARAMWQRVAEDEKLRDVVVGADYIEEHLTHSNTFMEFQYAVGDLWTADLYVSLGLLPPLHSDDDDGACGCPAHAHLAQSLLAAERRFSLPKKLRVHSSVHHSFCSGIYTAVRRSVNGMPLWEKLATEDDALEDAAPGTPVAWLYSSPSGVWTVSNRQADFATGAGHIAAGSKHNGWLPQANREWWRGDGKDWAVDVRISVRLAERPSEGFLDGTNVVPKVRAAVVGWLSDVQGWSRGPLPLAVFFLAVRLTDLCLARGLVRSGPQLHLTACGAAVLANASEGAVLLGEVPGSLAERLAALAGDTSFTADEVAAKADELEQQLGADTLRLPTVHSFLESFVERLREKEQLVPIVRDAAEFVAEFAILDYGVVSSYGSPVIAAAALVFSARMLPYPVPQCVDELRLLDGAVEFCVADLTRLILRPRKLTAVQKSLMKKYSTAAHTNISEFFDSIRDLDSAY